MIINVESPRISWNNAMKQEIMTINEITLQNGTNKSVCLGNFMNFSKTGTLGESLLSVSNVYQC